MTRLIDPPLKNLSSLMAEMGDLAIQSVMLAIDSYLYDKDTARQVHDISSEISKKYFQVADLTFDIFLRYQPVADDFRLIRSSIEISYGFTRFGRYAYDITQVRATFGDISECDKSWLVEVSEKVKTMIKDAVMYFAELDIRKALTMQENEDYVDRLYKERLPMLINSDNTKCALAEALVLRYLERLADHAMFMSDAINYIVTGKHKLTKQFMVKNALDLDFTRF
ncbi:MAG: phosphate uptake regulator PhoU [Nitrososphaeria archaeon]|nr:phosphate uptake regulator PhoU [Nitrososphaeria archaeon]NDB52076.1 phosphate uptake regulator PhoU [Nitrosopumilaceae archaeon]NDB88994.1 phosphate uptake regulator PhoU [Nitrososphaerota archaeon]NDB47166.1 phosphate uptake regulator PhoU [Nitrososphaeria archaeon]NDB63991.1 phosphate uptake regulator PhoU [Nitrosopumilaceae archaeon]